MYDGMYDRSSGDDPHQTEIDGRLRQSMAAPVPRLSPDFHQVLARELRRSSQPPGRLGQILLAGYGGVSAVVSVVVMRGQGLGWVAIAVMTIGPLVTLEVTRRVRSWRWGTAAR